MTSVKFLVDSLGLCGYEINGHCSYDGDDEAGKIVCAAVSSAVYMAANTITDIIGQKAEIEMSEARMLLKVKKPSAETKMVLAGLKLHLEGLSGQYSNNIRIYGGAKNVKD